MTAPSLTWKQVVALGPCDLAARRRKIKAAFPDYRTRTLTMADAAAAGVELDDLIWIAARSDERRARLFAADCAARVSVLANDPRSIEAIRCARLFARGKISVEFLASADASAAAADAAVSATNAAQAAAFAALAAAFAAAAAAIAAFAAASAAIAASAAASARAATAGNDERQWQRARLLAWFSDEEPDDWPIHGDVK